MTNYVKQKILLFVKFFVLYLAEHQYFEKQLRDLARDYTHEIRGFSYEFHKNGELHLINQVTKRFPNLICFDVGANIGDYTSEILKKNPSSNIHLFDIDPYLYSTLKKRFADTTLVINNFGLSNRLEEVTFSRFPDMPSLNSIFPIEHRHLKHCSTLGKLDVGDNYCLRTKIPRINFMKIDVEGWERYVLEGFEKMLETRSIDALTWKYGYANGESHWLTRDFYNYFSKFGYACGIVRKQGIDFRNWDYDLNDFTSGPNYFACLPEHKQYFAIRY